MLIVPYTITVTTFCDSLCAVQGSQAPTCKTVYCGDSILDQGEECDNGNKPGCQNCFIANGYTCIGNIGSTSLCEKEAICGDGIQD